MHQIAYERRAVKSGLKASRVAFALGQKSTQILEDFKENGFHDGIPNILYDFRQDESRLAVLIAAIGEKSEEARANTRLKLAVVVEEVLLLSVIIRRFAAWIDLEDADNAAIEIGKLKAQADRVLRAVHQLDAIVDGL